jgi:hypothetical protein
MVFAASRVGPHLVNREAHQRVDGADVDLPILGVKDGPRMGFGLAVMGYLPEARARPTGSFVELEAGGLDHRRPTHGVVLQQRGELTCLK